MPRSEPGSTSAVASRWTSSSGGLTGAWQF